MGKPRWLFSAGCRRSTRTIEAAHLTLDGLTAFGAETRQGNEMRRWRLFERGLPPLLVATEVFGLQRLVGRQWPKLTQNAAKPTTPRSQRRSKEQLGRRNMRTAESQGNLE
jgi:hypothetical protein